MGVRGSSDVLGTARASDADEPRLYSVTVSRDHSTHRVEAPIKRYQGGVADRIRSLSRQSRLTDKLTVQLGWVGLVLVDWMVVTAQ